MPFKRKHHPKNSVGWHRRRYSLHSRIADYTEFNVSNRTIQMNEGLWSKLPERVKRHIKELQEEFGYNVQTAFEKSIVPKNRRKRLKRIRRTIKENQNA